MPASIRIGTQGWNYDAWVGPFFPIGTRPADFLQTYARAFGTVEVDSTFYAVPSVSTFRGWAERTPADFVFSLKLPQLVTHEHRLRDITGTTERFFDGARELGTKLGPILVQLAPDFGPAELPALVDFLPRLPHDLHIAIEFRHRGWLSDGVLALLREYKVAVAMVDGRWIPRRRMLELAESPTADFAYIRWMGPNRDLVDYSRIQVDRSRELEQWRAVLSTLADSVADVYGYVANHFAGHSPATAREIQQMIGQEPVDPDTLGEQMLLF